MEILRAVSNNPKTGGAMSLQGAVGTTKGTKNTEPEFAVEDIERSMTRKTAFTS